MEDGVGDPHDELVLDRSVALRADFPNVRHLVANERRERRFEIFSNTLITALSLKFVQLVFPSRRVAADRHSRLAEEVEMLKSEETFIS